VSEPLSSGAARQRVERYYELVDAPDLDGMLALFAEDAVYERPGYEPLRGKEELDRFYGSERVIDTGRHTLDDVIADGDRVGVRGRFDGVLKDGREVSVRFADFFMLRGDLIAERHTYFFTPSV
jgi:ketosteroid isomerase-like protein